MNESKVAGHETKERLIYMQTPSSQVAILCQLYTQELSRVTRFHRKEQCWDHELE